MSGGDVIRQFFGAMASGDTETTKALVHEDFVMEWSQSGERFRGRDNAFGAISVQADRPEVEGEPRFAGSGDVWSPTIAMAGGREVPPADPDGSAAVQLTIDVDGGRVCFDIKTDAVGTPNRGHIHFAPPGANGGIVVPLFELAAVPAIRATTRSRTGGSRTRLRQIRPS